MIFAHLWAQSIAGLDLRWCCCCFASNVVSFVDEKRSSGKKNSFVNSNPLGRNRNDGSLHSSSLFSTTTSLLYTRDIRSFPIILNHPQPILLVGGCRVVSAIPLLCGTKGVERQPRRRPRRLAFGVGEKQIINEASGRVAAAAAAAAHDDDNNDDSFAIERRGAAVARPAPSPSFPMPEAN